MSLTKILAILTALLLALSLFIVSIEIVFPNKVHGRLTYVRTSGEEVTEIIVYIPLYENGENIFKVSQMEVSTSKGEVWSVTPGPNGVDDYPDYWILTGPPLRPGVELNVFFTMEKVRDIEYEAYPWRLQSDVETLVPVYVQKDYTVILVSLIENYRLNLAILLAASAAVLGGAAFFITVKKPSEEGVVYQEKPEMPLERPEKCKEWKTLCLRFFVVDECGGKRKKHEVGLLKGVKYDQGPFGELSENAVNKLLRLMKSANTIWERCCVKLAPCRDCRGKLIFKAFDPEGIRYKHVKVEELISEGLPYKVRVQVYYNIDLCQFLQGRRLLTTKGSKEGYEILDKAVWGDNPYIDELKDKKGEEISEEDLERYGLKDSYQKLLGKLEKKRKDDFDLLELFKEVVEEPRDPYAKRCVNVFIFGYFEDKEEAKGIASTPGRVIFLDESIVNKNEFRVLAHEIGHNLSLKHEAEKSNVMYRPKKGEVWNKEDCRELTSEQCRKVLEHLNTKSGKLKLCSKSEIETFQKEEEQNKEEMKKTEKVEEKKKPAKEVKVKEEKKSEEGINDIEKRIEKIKKEINSNRSLIRTYESAIRKILIEEYNASEEDLKGGIDEWRWPEGGREDEKIQSMEKKIREYMEKNKGLQKKLENLKGK